MAHVHIIPIHEYVDQVFQNKWIGQKGPLKTPPRSPDLNPLDYFLWGYLKSKIYKTKLANMEVLKERIRHGCRSIPPHIIANVRKGFYFCLA